ncbi:MAG: TonB family protein [Candidatus Gastranaerophilales bacterium]|nr:TonB family protein [Candidatus Gastranaerophilales bacterium]
MLKLGTRLDDDIEKQKNTLSPFEKLNNKKVTDKEITLEKALFISTVAHPAAIAILWLFFKILVIILALIGITLPLFEKPQPKIKDIEFVLVNKEQTPINKNTKYRADRNSRAGGKHDPNKTVSMPEPSAVKSKPQQKATQPKTEQPKASPSPKPTQPKIPVPPKPQPNNAVPKPKLTAPKSFNIPVPMTKAPTAVSPSGGPVTSAPLQSASPSSSPTPVMASGGSSGSYTQNRYSGKSSFGGGSAGNPGPGNPNGEPGIDALAEPDFGPYMRELQRRIKRNWDPPKGNESKRIVLMFKISKDGRLLSLKVIKSSGVTSADRAAISAVELTAPFKPLPKEYKGNDVDIQFTFDYNVFGASRY